MESNLIGRYRHKDKFIIEKVVSEYSSYVYTITKNMSKFLKSEDIEEIVADVFLVIWNNKDKLDDALSIKPYIIGVTKNIVRNRLRNMNFNFDITEYEEVFISKEDLDVILEQKEKNVLIKNAIDKLKEQDRNVFISYYYSSKSIKQISKEQGITVENVKKKLQRIRKKIRKVLIEGGYSYYGR